MIPQKISLEGFLCYRARQDVDLSEYKLAMLAGPNGSGKSSVFDAVTFALFGEHRAGSQHLEDLINKAADKAVVEFDFLLDGQPWQIYRTIRRSGRSAGEVRRWVAASGVEKTAGAADADDAEGIDGAAGRWEGVPDATTVVGLKKWVAANLGLKAGTFTRSMLLRQGESDLLLSKESRERFEVLAGVVDLERYRKLEDAAKGRFRQAQGQVEQCRTQLAAIEPVTDIDLEAATLRATASAEAARAAEAVVQNVQTVVADAKRWVELTGRLREVKAQQARHADLLGRADQVEADHRRLADLTAALPHLSAIADLRGRLAASEQQAAHDSAAADEAEWVRAAVAGQGQTAAESIARLEAAANAADALLRELGPRLADAQASLRHADATARQRSESADADQVVATLLRKHADPAGELTAARAEVDRLAAIADAVPRLRALREHRSALTDARRRLSDGTAGRERAATEAAQASAERAAADVALYAAEGDLRAARQSETEAQTSHRHAAEAMARLEDVGSSPDCPACGQPLTEAHLAGERERRSADVAKCVAEVARTAAARSAAESATEQRRAARSAADEKQRDAALREQAHAAGVERARADIRTHTPQCRRAYDGLPADLQDPVDLISAGDDWTATTWPAEAEVTRIAAEADGLTAARDRATRGEQTHARWRETTMRADALRAALSAGAGGTAADVASLREQFAALEVERSAAERTLTDGQSALKREREASRRLAEQAETGDAQLAKLRQALATETTRQDEVRKAIEQARAHLSAEWSTSAADVSPERLAAWKTERADLDRRGAADAFRLLADAKASAALLAQRSAELETDAAGVPEAARVSPADAEAQAATARTERATRDRDRQQADARLSAIRHARAQRLALDEALRSAERRQRQAKVLADLLGKRRLQLFLVRQAERNIVDCANGILDRLSGGDLRLQLRGTGTGGKMAGGSGAVTAGGSATAADDGKAQEEELSDSALDLEAVHRKTAGGEPISVHFLSGSQRFRVAVSLALALGQYAGNHRCGECVIIDEGFGSLDSQGQQVMIQELQRLQGIMERIVLVSHQESFADAFPHGYRFALVNGETRVTRLG